MWQKQSDHTHTMKHNTCPKWYKVNKLCFHVGLSCLTRSMCHHLRSSCRPEDTKGWNLIQHPSVRKSVDWMFRFLMASLHKTVLYQCKLIDVDSLLSSVDVHLTLWSNTYHSITTTNKLKRFLQSCFINLVSHNTLGSLTTVYKLPSVLSSSYPSLEVWMSYTDI